MDKYSLKELLSQGFSQLTVEDLEKSGLSLDTVKRMGLLPLTPETFKEYLHFSLVEKATREPIVLDGYVIPYPSPVKFGRLKVLKWNERSHYAQNRKELPKYLQPSSQHVENPLKLYHLPDVNIKSPKKVYFITEGEKKTAKLQQELEKIDEKFVALGLGGVWNWNETTFSEAGVSFRDRKVYLVFDADGKDNPSVARAELRLYGYLLSRGAVSVKSLVWDKERGKGIDDYLTACEVKELENLLSSAVSPIEKYKDTVSFQTVIEELAESLQELSSQLTEEIKKAYGVGKREIKRKFQEARERKRREIEERLRREEEETVLRIYQSLFNVKYIPEIPEGYSVGRYGDALMLFKDGRDLTEPFVVAERLTPLEKDGSEEGEKLRIVLPGDREFWVSLREIGDKKFFKELAAQTILPGKNQNLADIQEYLKRFFFLNKNKIPVRNYVTKIGWVGDRYVLPQTSPEVVIKDVSKNFRGFGEGGSRDEEYKAVKEIVENNNAGILWFVGLLAPLLHLTKDERIIFYVYGTSGLGKTTSSFLALSLYGNWDELRNVVDGTKVGDEIQFDYRKDTLILLDEIDSVSGEVRKKINQLIHHFAQGRGKRRATIDLKQREQSRYRGILLLTAERSLYNVVMTDKELKQGVFRRTIQVPVDRLYENDKSEFLSDDAVNLIIHNLSSNYGHLIKEWIDYVSKKENLEKLINLRNLYLSSIKDRGYEFRGQERFISLLGAVIETAGEFFEIDTRRYGRVLNEIIEDNYEQFAEVVLSFEERVLRRLSQFIYLNADNFIFPEDDSNKRLNALYGKIEDDRIIITDAGLDVFCNGDEKRKIPRLEVDKRVLIRRLKKAGIITGRTSISYKGFESDHAYIFKRECISLPTNMGEEEIDL